MDIELPKAQALLGRGRLAGIIGLAQFRWIVLAAASVFDRSILFGKALGWRCQSRLFEEEGVKQRIEFSLPVRRRRQCGMSGAPDAFDVTRTQQTHGAQKHHHLLMRESEAMPADKAGE